MQASQNITRKSGSNLALAFVLLPREKQQAMSALYAFCREVDDAADEDARPVAERRATLAAWREDIRLACQGGAPAFPVNRELQPVIAAYGLAFEHFDALIRGCEMDLMTTRYADMTALENYCYHVASVVGLLSIRIFGYRDPACPAYAVDLGKALQLTNILRDVGTDAARGRIYLPLEILTQCGVSPDEILQRQYSGRYFQAAAMVAARARHFYRQARALLPPADRPAMVAAELMGAVYWQLLLKLERRRFDVLNATVRLSKPHKLSLIFFTWCRFALGLRDSRYGTS